MNLVVIDDQTSVVNGLLRGVNWKRAGILQVYTAYNAFEAKKIFLEHPVDIMLCDIEMPVENGLSLYKWVLDSGYETECIFLTAHAEFDYAREALTLKSFDYIVQPAPYDEVEMVVARAVARVNEKRMDKKERSYGKYLMEKSTQMQIRMLGDWFTGRVDRSAYEDFSRLENMLSLEQEGYPVLLQIVRQTLPIDQWEPELMRFTFQNVISECFEPYEQAVALCEVGNGLYGFVVYGYKGYRMDYPGVLRQLEYCRKSFGKYLKCEAAFFANPVMRVENMPNIIHRMVEASRENVSMRCEVFDMSAPVSTETLQSGHVRIQMKRWESYISQNLSNMVKEEIFQFLDQAALQGRLTSSALLNFHMEFSKMIFTVAEHSGRDIHGWMKEQSKDALYAKAPASLDDMKSFVSMALDYMKLQLSEDSEQHSPMEQIEIIEGYIHDHIESEITRDDLAEYVHLNVDYLGRIFKKYKGISLKEYIIEEKLNVARNLLKTTMLPISFVASKVGYSNFSHFSRIYKKVFGISPTDERKQ